ncbi:hypothetical protein LOC68_15490 [Blastopirellula sp. JC732]|uniref:Uncharacterized protein n=1 Tax=Blastopirellula sediminis TaxID=2894196 RepID=A0A9X1MP17_9BACT|nr:hypothetical protein [Blastopirellula sediminis]MCC9606913.1 hypothetical protein [Blastopirellula sediminis]MCC9629792.1 hypothetical protein [Blastopirellula sediminis]
MISALLVVAAIVSADADAKPPLTAKASRDNTQIRLLSEEKRTVIDVECPIGIDNAIVKRTGDKWPEPLIVRLHLKGLESFRVENYAWNVSSSGVPRVLVSVPDGGTVQLGLAHRTTPLRIVNSVPKIPLQDGGYFEVTLPDKLFENNPAELKLSWVDFYR